MEEWGGAQQEKLAKLRDHMKSYYQAARPPCQAQQVTADMLWARTATAPKFKAKGAETRHLLPFGLQRCQEHLGPDEHSQLRYSCCKAMVQFYTVMNQEEFNPELAKRASN